MEKAFFVYAWDLIAEGPENALGKIQDLGANTICLASSYHAGKFTRPRAASGKIFFPDDGTIYFGPIQSITEPSNPERIDWWKKSTFSRNGINGMMDFNSRPGPSVPTILR